jgi:hypothetical protein
VWAYSLVGEDGREEGVAELQSVGVRWKGNEEECSVSDQIKKDELGKTSCTCREQRNAYRELQDKYEGNSPHGRPRHRWLGEKKQNLKKERMALNVVIWFTTETKSLILCKWKKTFKLHRILGIS